MRWHSGQEAAFEVLYKRHIRALVNTGFQKTGDSEIARELAQEVFVKLYNHKDGVLSIQSMAAYLNTSLKNAVLDHYRKRSVRARYEAYLAQKRIVTDDSTESYILMRDLEKQLNEEIEKLPVQCRTVFKLSRKEHLSNKQIASNLGISENTVEQHIRRAIRGLKTALGGLILSGILALLLSIK